MRTCRGAILAVLLFLGTASTAVSQTTVTATADQDSTHGRWINQPWGEVYLARFESAPYPDDSRTTGLTNRSGKHFPPEVHYKDNTVVIAAPNGYKPQPATNVIIHFHGHGNTAPNCLMQFRLGEQLQASGRNAILVLPQGPKNAGDSGCGKLEKSAGLTKFLDELAAFLTKEGRIPEGGQIADVILSAHSGGYKVTGLAMEHGGATDRVREAWLFDAAYGQWDELARPFASPDSGRRLRSICTEHLAPENWELMSRLCLRGAPVFVVRDDNLATAGLTRAQYDGFPFHSADAKFGGNELPALLRKHPNLFMYTTLSHNDLIMAENYFEQFARESPSLEAR